MFRYPRFQLIFHHQISHTFLEQLRELKMQRFQLQQINSYLVQSLIDHTWSPLTKTQPSTSPHLHDSVNERSSTLLPSICEASLQMSPLVGNFWFIFYCSILRRANSRFLGLVSVWAARSFDQTALRPSVIKRIRQIDVKYITHITSFGVTA